MQISKPTHNVSTLKYYGRNTSKLIKRQQLTIIWSLILYYLHFDVNFSFAVAMHPRIFLKRVELAIQIRQLVGHVMHYYAEHMLPLLPIVHAYDVHGCTMHRYPSHFELVSNRNFWSRFGRIVRSNFADPRPNLFYIILGCERPWLGRT